MKYEDQQVRNLPLIVTRGKDKAAIFGLQWLERIKLNWHKVCCMRVLQKHTKVFREELGTLKGFAAKIHVDEGKPPKFFKVRPVPYAMRKKVEQELDRLVQTNVMEPVRYSDWATQILPVLKADGKVRVCGDYKLTVNRVSHLEQYPIPTLDDLCVYPPIP